MTTDPDTLAAELSRPELPPVNQWHPSRVGEIDIRIAADGSWFHEGRPINRKPLYKLFSTVLRRDNDDEYYLVTPVEKLRIQVDDAPFVAVSMQATGSGENQQLVFTTNCDDLVSCDAEHRLRTLIDPDSGEPRPYLRVRDRLDALVSRSVFYELVELASRRDNELGIWSGGCYCVLGPASD